MKLNFIAAGNWPKGWTPTMQGNIVIQAYGTVLNQLVRIHPGCISNDRPPNYTVDKAKNEVMLDFLMEARNSDHAVEIKNTLESLLARNGLRYTEDWTGSGKLKMKVDEAKVRLVGVLESNGFDLENPNPSIAWTAFKKFVTESVACPDDGILFRVGCHDFTGAPRCRFGFVRQFTFVRDSLTGDGDVEYRPREVLRLELTCDPTQDLVELLGMNLSDICVWSYNFRHIEEFFDAVESLPFLHIGSAIKAWDCEICQEIKDDKVKSGDVEIPRANSSEDVAKVIRAEALRAEILRNASAAKKKWWQFWK